jgi:anthranilate phosphoribosyltransferase
MRGMVGAVHRFIKAIGAGPKRARDLSRAEAAEAMRLIASGAAAPEQIGAFLLALRMKGEHADELAGFVDALDEPSHVGARVPGGLVDVDAHGDGHEGRPSLLPAAACAAAALGTPVVLRVDLASSHTRHGIRETLLALGLSRERPLDRSRGERALAEAGLAVLDLASYAPALKRLVDLRPRLGVRTAAQTAAKLLDPLRAETHLVGVFHAPYLPLAADALARLGRRGLCVQAIGGLPEATPGKQVRVAYPGVSATLPSAPTTIDLRALDAEVHMSGDAAAANRAALEGREPEATRAAAAAALILHAAHKTEPLKAAADALGSLRDGGARAVARRLSTV